MNKLLLLAASLVLISANSHAQNVGIGTNAPLTKLDINGALSARITDLAAANTITVPANVTLVRITATAGLQTNTISVTSPQNGQFLTILNEDNDAASIGTYVIQAGSAANPGVGNLVYIAGGGSPGWKATSDNNTVPDATTAVKGIVQLAGDLAGTATSPQIATGAIVNADINASAAIADSKLATISTSGKVSNSATTATSASSLSTIVARDASGNFAATTITAALSGNATTATGIAGGIAGKIPYQTGAGTTAFTTIAPGTTAGLYMRSTGASNTWDASAIQTADLPATLSGAWTRTSPYVTLVTSTDNVGIGTSTPQKRLDIKTPSTTGVTFLETVGGSTHLAGAAVGIAFDPEGYGNRNKIAIVAEGNGQGWSQGNLRFLSRTTIDNTEATLSNTVMSIMANGNVGIGSGDPTLFKLQTAGVIASDQGSNKYVTLGQDPAGSSSPTTFGGLYFDGSSNLRLEALSGGVSWRDIVIQGQGTGKVGIGTTSPAYLLDIEAGSNAFRVRGAAGAPSVMGGTMVVGATHTTVTFTSSGIFMPNGAANVEVLVVGGGGGGGARHGGGGGGGGVVYNASVAVTNQMYTVVVGAGGAAGVYTGTNTGAGGNGGNSSFPGVTTAIGGGGGRTYDCCGGTGGSGGGGAGVSPSGAQPGLAGTGGQGNNGGNGSAGNPSGGGGGGAGGVGANATSNGGAGGSGSLQAITGLTYGGGGGGGGEVGFVGGAGGSGGGGHGGDGGNATNKTAGTNGLGGGGGGDRNNTGNTGSAGGSGVVVIRYPNSTTFTNTTSNPTLATGAGNSVGIGVAPTTIDLLEVAGFTRSRGYRTRSGIIGSYGSSLFNYNWTGTNLELWVDATNLGNVTYTSDRRLKYNIKPAQNNAIEKVMALNPVNYKYKNIEGTVFRGNPNDTIEGFIADELQAIIPSAVNGKKDALTAEGNIQPQTVNIIPVVSVLTKAMQEQQAQIEQLKKENSELKSENANVKMKNEELSNNVKVIKAQVDLINERLNLKTEK